MKVLISGAGLAGPALAWWLKQQQHEVTVVERATALREGGQAVDFRGPVHREVLTRMGLWGPVHEHRTPGSDLILLGANGAPLVNLPTVMMSGDVEILRGDLVRLLHERTTKKLPLALGGEGEESRKGSVEYRFGTQVVSLQETPKAIEVTLSGGQTERYDLVVGADGLHSRVRALAFGPEDQYLRHHGYRVATFSLPDVLHIPDHRTLSYAEPGRALTVGPDRPNRSRATFIFTGPPLGDEDPRELLRTAFATLGWEAQTILAHLDAATDLYVDDIGSIAIDRYSQGRVVLLGDAAYGGTLGGQGTSLALVGACVLAAELAASPNDLASAFHRYETRLRPYAEGCQKGAERVGGFFAPRTRLGLALRNLMYRAMTSRLFIRQFEKLVKSSASAFELPAPSSTLSPTTG